MTTSATPQHRARRRRRILTVRTRLTLVAVLSITALLGFVLVDGWGQWQQQTILRNDDTTGRLGGEASLPLFIAAQAERTLTAAYLARPTAAAKRALQQQRAVTDQGVTSFRHLSGSELETSKRHKWEYVERVYTQLDGLVQARRDADARTGDPDKVTGYYTSLLATMVVFYQQLSAMDDATLTQETRPLVSLFWASEGLSQEDMLVAQAVAVGTMSAEQRRQFAAAYGTQIVMYQRWIAPYLPAKDKAAYDHIVASSAWHTVQHVEADLISAPTKDSSGSITVLPASVSQWSAAHAEVAQQLGQLNLSRTQGLLVHGYQRADEIRTAVYVKAGVSLTVVIALGVLIFGVIRSITSRLGVLKASAEQTATRLPEVVGRLQRGESVDVHGEFPGPRDFGDEFAGLGAALTAAQHTAVQMAALQAADRRGFAGFVVATSGRALNLVETLLELLDGLQRKYEQDGPVLTDLISIDHRGGVVRRHLDNLQTVAGGHREPYTEPRSLADLVYDAAAESDDPQRILNKVGSQVWIRPQAVNAVMHILSALLDNALSYSHDKVTVTTVSPVHGIAVEIEDMGTGMTFDELNQANGVLLAPMSFEDMSVRQDGRLGLFVVGRLADRYRIRVSLRPGDYGGVKAVVHIPGQVQCAAPDHQPVPARPAAAKQHPLPQRGTSQAPSSAPLPPEQPRPRGSHAPAAPRGTGEDVRTEDSAPPLPRRSASHSTAPQLERRAPDRSFDPAADLPPETVGAAWGAWQNGTSAAESTPTQENETR